MKIRNGFVSNSSSSSFCIRLSDLEKWQIIAILTNDYSDSDWREAWDSIYINEKNQTIEGYTSMDNYGMGDFFEKLGIPDAVIMWDNE